jgi:hypothetical protein
MSGGDAVTIDMGASMETEEALAIIDNLNQVTDVQAMSGPEVTFIGTRATSLAPVQELEGIDVYSCPRGFLILFRQAAGPHGSAAGSDLPEAVAAIEDEGLRRLVSAQLQGQQFL